MPPSQILKEGLEEFDDKLSWLPKYYRPIQINDDFSKRDESADIVDMLKENQVIELVKSFLTTHTLNILKAERERVVESINTWKILAGPLEKLSIHYRLGYSNALENFLVDQISYLDQEIKKIEENK